MGCSGSVPAGHGRGIDAPLQGNQETPHRAEQSGQEDSSTDVDSQNRNNSGVQGREVKGHPKQQPSSANGSSLDHGTPMQQNAPISTEENHTAPVKTEVRVNTDKNSSGHLRDVTASSISEKEAVECFPESSAKTVQGEENTRGGESSEANPDTTVVSDSVMKSKIDTKPGETVPAMQDRFNTGINGLNLSVNPESFVPSVTDAVRSLTLPRALPYTVDMYKLMKTLTNLQVRLATQGHTK